MVQSQPGDIVLEILSRKTFHTQKNRAGGVAQGEGPEFKPQNHKERKKERNWRNKAKILTSRPFLAKAQTTRVHRFTVI
jgi:hypothetical protein